MQIINGLYVGGDEEYQRVADSDGWSWLRCCKEGPGGHRDLLGYRTLGAPKNKDYLWVERGNLLALNLLDANDPNFIPQQLIHHGVEFIKNRIHAGDKVLAACNMGHSRGPTVALLYLRSIGEMPHSFVQSEHIFRTIYPKYSPGQGMRQFARSQWASYAPKGS